MRHRTFALSAIAILAGCSSSERTSGAEPSPEGTVGATTSTVVVDQFAAVLRRAPRPTLDIPGDRCASRPALQGLELLAVDLGDDCTPASGTSAIAAPASARFERAGDVWNALVAPSKGRHSTAILARVKVPATADGWVELDEDDPSEPERIGLRFRLKGASPAVGRAERDYVAYSDVLAKGRHVLQRASYDGVEDFVLFPERPADERITYEVDMTRVAGLRLVDKTLEFVDSRGVPRLRMNPPSAIDSAGSRFDLRVGVLDCAVDSASSALSPRVVRPWPQGNDKTTCSVAVDFAPSGSDAAPPQYPLVVDPSWSTTNSMSNARANFGTFSSMGKTGTGTPTLARVYAIGGYTGSACSKAVDSFNPSNNRWFSEAALPEARCMPTIISVRKGDSLAYVTFPGVLGGASTPANLQAGTGTSTFWLLWPNALNNNVWRTMTPMDVSRVGHAAIPLTSTAATEKVFVIGGFGTASTAELSVGALTSTSPTSSWTPKANLPSNRGGHAVLVHTDGIVAAGGNATFSSSGLTTAVRYDTAANTWTATGSMSSGRIFAAVHLPGIPTKSTGYVIGGTSSQTNFVEAYSFTAGTWSVSAARPTGLSGTGLSATFLSSTTSAGSDLIVGGTTAYVLKTSTSGVTFEDAKNPIMARTSHGAARLDSQTVLVMGGIVGGAATPTVEIWRLGDLPRGATCTDSPSVHGACAAGLWCVDGVCCENTCIGECMACSLAKTGSPNGTCAQVKGGTDPDNECSAATGADAFCQPGACAPAPATGCHLRTNEPCSMASCPLQVGSAYVGWCTVSGETSSCVGSSTISCAGYVCSSGACLTSCTGHTQCTAGNRCVANKCVPGLAAGAICSSSDECNSGFCVDGVCCSVQCSGDCMGCSTATTSKPNGECHPVLAGSDPRNKCASSGTLCGADGLCDGAGACRLFAPKDKACGATTCIDADTVSGQLCDGTGICMVQNNDCSGGFKCVTSACLTVCTQATDCLPGYFCSSEGKCTASLAPGSSCTADSQCASGACVDNTCCNVPCSGLCMSCNASYTGVSGGICSPVEAGKDPRSQCAASGTQCGADGSCNGSGECRVNMPAGTNCGAPVCTDNDTRVAAQECNGSGVCAASSISTSCGDFKCAAGACLTTCASSADCAPGRYCDQGVCTGKLPPGAVCSSAEPCLSGFCADGICCDSACSGACMNCQGQFTGLIDGQCGQVLVGLDPRNACAQDSDACKADGTCDGAGQCRAFAEAGSPCGTPTCSDNDTKVTSLQCDGSGACMASTQTTDCAGFKCVEGQCLTTCVDSTQCAPGHFCSNLGQCSTLLTDGNACTAGTQCLSGHCVDGVCCDTACDKTCQSCSGSLNQSGQNGKCGLVKAGEMDPRNVCQQQQDPKDLCGVDGSCDAAGKCRLAPKGNACGAAACSNNSSVVKECDGFGACQETSTACSPYACDNASASCKQTCNTKTDCATEATCEVVSKQCVLAGSTCKDSFTVKHPDGTETTCAPYTCAAGACRDSCSTSNDCSNGYSCSGKSCVLTPASDSGTDSDASTAPPQSLDATSDSGCGCRTSDSRPSPAGLAFLGLAIAALARRRPRA